MSDALSGLAFFGFLLVTLILVFTLVRLSDLKKSIDQIPQMIARIFRLEQRLLELERKIASPAATHEPQLVATATDVVAKEAQVAVPVVSHAAAAPPHAMVGDSAQAPPRPVVAEPVPHAAASATQQTVPPPAQLPANSQAATGSATDIESLIAGRWLNVLGILALVVAAAFFLKYAFDNDWIGPTGRVAIGITSGMLLFPLSDWLTHRGFKYFAEGIAALGVAILYLSIWTGWHSYDLFPQAAAFGFMVLITVAIMVVALVRDSQRMAVLALIGGLLTPAITSTGENKEEALFVYLVILGVAAVAMACMRRWRVPVPLQFFGTLVYFWGWYADFYSTGALNQTLAFATIFFALFAVLPAVRALRSGQVDGFDLVITLANSLEYLGVLGALLWPDNRDGLAFALLMLAAVHLGAVIALAKSATKERTARIVYGGLALTFATIAIPVLLDGQWITIALALEAAALVGGGLRVSSGPLRAAGLAIYPLILVRLLASDIDAASTFLLNSRFLTFAICAASMVAAFFMVRNSETEVGSGESKCYYALSICGNFVFLWALSTEVWNFFGRSQTTAIDRSLAQELALSVLWIVYAGILLAVGMVHKSAALRWQALALLGIAVAKVFIFDLSFLTRFYRILSFFILGLVLMAVSFLYQRRSAPDQGS
jgi:uncharacterized membrane protein